MLPLLRVVDAYEEVGGVGNLFSHLSKTLFHNHNEGREATALGKATYAKCTSLEMFILCC